MGELMTIEHRKNVITYLVFLLIALFGIYFGSSFFGQTKSLRVWDYTNLLWMLVGIPFLFLQTQSKLPNFWQRSISNRFRFKIPLVIGVIFGTLDVIIFQMVLPAEPYVELPPFLQPFPYSILLYFSGAFEVEVFYRLIPLTLILILGNWYRNGKYYNAFFWTGALLTAIREPLEQVPDGGVLLLLYSILTGFSMNLLQAIWYRKAGFLASLSIRLGHYLLWHILLGIYIEYMVLQQY
tara:strand:+ start:1672 stop:2385 length:714 start_codon:yes stop_codon:yes gene_type:complete